MLIRVLSALILALLIGGAVRPSLIAALRPSWRSTRPAGPEDGLSIWPLRFSRDPFPAKLVSFFEKVRKEIPRGASVAVLLPEPWHRPEYAYARSRLRYLLARHPVAFPIDSAATVFEKVDYVAAWHPAIPPPHGLELVFSQHEGVLMRRGDR